MPSAGKRELRTVFGRAADPGFLGRLSRIVAGPVDSIGSGGRDRTADLGVMNKREHERISICRAFLAL